jgi:XTP/dITP diphosphohydrolase
VGVRDRDFLDKPVPIRILLASSNAGKLREYHDLAAGLTIELDLLPRFSDFPAFEEFAPTFAENAAGKALHYSELTEEIILADDSGLVVPSLGGEPGVHSARYAGANATDSDRVRKLLHAMENEEGDGRRARFVCVIAIALQGHVLEVVSDSVEGVISREPRGENGFGYDPVFLFPDLNRTYAEISRKEKNRISHRGKAFRRLLTVLTAQNLQRGI